MEEAKALAMAQAQQQMMQQQQQQQQHQQQQQQKLLLLQQLQRQKQQQEAMSRFPSNIDAHLRPPQHHLLHRPQPTNPPQPPPSQHAIGPNSNPNSHQIPNLPQNPNSNNNNGDNVTNNSNSASPNPQQQQQQKASLQMAYQDAWRVCHPDVKRPFSSLEDACERLLPYHVVADYEAEEDDKILDSDTTGQVLSRCQQWDNNIAAKVAEFTATFEKQVLAFNIISRKRGQGDFRTEEKLMMEQFLLQDEKRALLEIRAEMESRQKASRESHEANLRMAAMAHVDQGRGESQSQSEMMVRPPIRPNALGSQGNNMSMGHGMSEQDQDVNHEQMINGWGNNMQKDEKEPSDDFLNDEETENGDAVMQNEWRGGGELDLNAR